MNTPPIKIKLRSLRSRKNILKIFPARFASGKTPQKKFSSTTSTQNRCISRPVHKSDPEPKSSRTYTRVIGLMHGSWGSDLCTGGGVGTQLTTTTVLQFNTFFHLFVFPALSAQTKDPIFFAVPHISSMTQVTPGLPSIETFV